MPEIPSMLNSLISWAQATITIPIWWFLVALSLGIVTSNCALALLLFASNRNAHHNLVNHFQDDESNQY